jgi:hypothetical protein
MSTNKTVYELAMEETEHELFHQEQLVVSMIARRAEPNMSPP